MVNSIYAGNIQRRPVNAAQFFSYSDLPDTEARRWVTNLEPQVADVYSAVVRSSCWEMDIPVTYVASGQGLGARVVQAVVARMKRENWTIETMESGYCPFLGRVEEVGEFNFEGGVDGVGDGSWVAR